MEIERRRHPRFRVRDNAFAAFQPEPVKLVPIIDIGLGGLVSVSMESIQALNG
jgi:hypothetical protein